jgi:8-oxo-dGTP diphosphatase
MAIYLVRHGHAGTRAKWKGDDADRPLSNRGTDQAKYLAKLLGDRPITRVYSSPSRRCIDTVAPLAKQVHREVKTRDVLLEGADPDEAIAFLLDRAKQDPVVCSHGDLIPKVIRRLIGAGMRTDDANISQKGSVWEIEVEKGKAVRARYHAPGSVQG